MVDSTLFDKIARRSAARTVHESINHFERTGEQHASLTAAVAEGALDGAVQWLLEHVGKRATYEILQTRADTIASSMIEGRKDNGPSDSASGA
jgi:hypothetical protein